jgi:type IV pilus assembly protein PilA
MRKINNKGFTLVELLAVLAILVIIMTIALPNISSSIERSKAKQNSAMEKVIISAGKLYVSNHKNNIQTDGNNKCYISMNKLTDENYLSKEDIENFTGSYIIYNSSDYTYTFNESGHSETEKEC